jgi:hypothetical protein
VIAGVCTHRVVPYDVRVRVNGMDGRFGEDVRAIPVDWHHDEAVEVHHDGAPLRG